MAMVAKVNKQFVLVAPGTVRNSAAALFNSASIPCVTPTTKIFFNECSKHLIFLIIGFGFVPHGGNSYYLSRMDGEMGVFLALTCAPINGADAM
jgi:enoyl-CoA hydratase/carnithine racemase